MDKEEFIRIRTDAFQSLVTNHPFDSNIYLKAFADFYESGQEIEKEDTALLGMMNMEKPSPYSMRNIDNPSPVTNLSLPDAYDDFLAGQRKFATTYAQDWPQADENNAFGKRHPFSRELPTMPLLHGSQWGEPHFIEHLWDSQKVLEQMANNERLGIMPQEFEALMGRPHETQHQLFKNDREGRHSFLGDDEYKEYKMQDWEKMGLLSNLFGLEWNSFEQRESFMDMLKKLGQTENAQEGNARKIMNDFAPETGISWGRAKRNWFERFMPLLNWWKRPSDRHGPVSGESPPSGLGQYKSAYINDGEEVLPSHTHHHWQPFQHGGGVGRDGSSLVEVLKQSYPAAFTGWLGDELMGMVNNKEHPLSDSGDGFHSSGSTFFPQTANDERILNHPHRSAIATGWESDSDHPRVRSINRRRGLWSSVANHHQVHPSEIKGNGGRMILPSEALTLHPLGRVINAHTDMGWPRGGSSAERHTGDEEYHSYHNDHYENSDENIGRMMREMSIPLMEKHGSDLFTPIDPTDVRANTIARGNVQQLAQAANYQMMRGNTNHQTVAPQFVGDGLVSQEVPVGPVHPNSMATTPPVYLSGDMDAWGHKMPATLAYKWNNDEQGVQFDIKDKPFETLQRTVHENHLQKVNPIIIDHQMQPKVNDIPALFATNESGHTPILSGELWKSDDYEPTGIFEKIVQPAHTIYDLSSVDDLKGFSGDWVVQSKPEGKRLYITKQGGHIKAHNARGKDISLPGEVRDSIRKQDGNCVFDGVLKDKHFRAIDLLVHKGDDIHMEPLEDRLQILRTMYETDEGVSFPMPIDCKFTDRDGLQKNIESIETKQTWLRDANSAFIKGKETHHRWILFSPNGDDIAKINGPIPNVSSRNGNIVLEYTGHTTPLLVEGSWDGEILKIENIIPDSPLAIHAKMQVGLWGPVATHLLKYDIPQIGLYPPTITTKSSMVFTRAALLDTAGNESNSQHLLINARKLLTDMNESLTPAELKAKINGLTEEMLSEFGGEYGLERTEEGLWSVNEAIDDELIENMGSPLARVTGTVQGGGWSGMMDMLTAPRGPTQLTDEEATPFFDPYRTQDGSVPPQPQHIKIETIDEEGEGIEGEIEIEGSNATLRFPVKTPQEEKEEAEVNVPVKEEPTPPPMPPMPPQGAGPQQ